jgi:hypothetical protein
VAAPLIARGMKGETAAPVIGQLIAWFFAGLAIHGLVLYYAALTASQRLAEDKQSGALELILCTPTTDRTLSRGLWLAYARNMLFPALLAVLVFFFLVWIFMVMASFDPPAHLPHDVTPGEIFWGALLDQPIRGRVLYWQFGFMLRAALLVLLLLMLTWLTLGWVGRWLGLRMKHPGFAPVVSLALLLAPPILLYSLACYLVDKFHLMRLPERQLMPLMTWLALAIGCGHCLGLSIWAAARLRHHLRLVAMSRYQPPSARQWRLPSWRTIRRFAIGTAVCLAVVALLVVSYYGYQNWCSKRAWRTFQAELKQRGESLNLSLLLPKPVPDAANFACSPVFVGLLSETNTEAVALLDQVKAASLMDWAGHNPAPLYPFTNTPGSASAPASSNFRKFPAQKGAARISPRPPRTALPTRPRGDFETNRLEEAAAVMQRLQPQSEMLRELATAAARCTAFQTSTNRDTDAVLHPAREPAQLLEDLHLLFQVRACASLALGRGTDAGEDVLTGLRLARLARQLPDTGSTVRAQRMVTRSLQPLWEGLNQHAWTEPQLAAFQHDLAGFNLLADYTNVVQRAVLANIEVWRAIHDGGKPSLPRPNGMYAIVNSNNPSISLAATDGDSLRLRAWQMQPHAWWFEFCIQLYDAGRNAIEQVDVATGRIQQLAVWSDLEGLPVDSQVRDLLLSWSWWWNANPASVAFAQTAVNQATIACALERFRLANGEYPETLDKLLPGLLASVPHDAISGRPIIYQPAAEGPMILRGVGPNGVDDRKNKSSDDWLWTYSTNSPSAKK